MYVVGTPPCKLCERIVLTVESFEPIETLLELPNTFNVVGKKYSWKRDDNLSYVLIPQSAHETTGTIDLYLCIDEDLLDDIDVRGFAARFLQEKVFPLWGNFKDVHLSEAVLATPDVVGCWKRHQETMENIH